MAKSKTILNDILSEMKSYLCAYVQIIQISMSNFVLYGFVYYRFLAICSLLRNELITPVQFCMKLLNKLI